MFVVPAFTTVVFVINPGVALAVGSAKLSVILGITDVVVSLTALNSLPFQGVLSLL